jgi:hypothetical protein
LQVGEDDEALSELEEMSNKAGDADDDMPENRMRKRRKKAKNNNRNHKSILPIVLGVSLLIAAYFAFNFYRSYDLLNDDGKLVKEINAITSAESFLYYVYNAQSQLYIKNVDTIIKKTPIVVVEENINNIFELDSTIHEVIDLKKLNFNWCR